jgi:hypothetical protein
MYRIELSPGEETVFRSIEELAVAIKRGVVTARARIYHNASNKWLPIQFHPHYKAAVAMQLTKAALVAGAPVKPLSFLNLEEPIEPEPPAPVFIAPEQNEVRIEPAPRKKTARMDRPAERRVRRPGKPRRQLRIALVGALLVGGAQWVLSAPLFSRIDAAALIQAQRHLIAGPAAAIMPISSPNTAAMIPVLPTSAVSTAPAQLEGIVESRPRATAPSFGGTSSVEAAVGRDLQPPPFQDISAAPAPTADSLGALPVDSTSKKAMKGILRTVSGVSVKERPTQR